MALGSVTISGMASGLPADMVDQLVNAQKTRLKAYERDQTFFTGQQTAIGELETKMLALEAKSKELQETSAWSPHTVTSSNEDYITASADSTALASIHSIAVGQLATYDTYAMDASSGLATATTTLGTGANLSFTYNGTLYGTGTTSGFDSSDLETMTLSDLASAINGIDYGDEEGVSASVLYDGSKYRLLLTAKDSGVYTDSGGTKGSRITAVTSGFSFTQTVAPQDAILNIDGIDVVSSSNQVTDALTGVTLNLQEVTSSTTVTDSDGDGYNDAIGTVGSTIKVTIQNDTTAMKTVLTGFLDSYNAVVDYVNTHKSDTLSGDTVARSVLSQMRSVLNTATQNSSGDLAPYSTLASMGLRTDQKTGKISFDSTSLDDALAYDFNGITKLFTSEHTSTGDTFTEGVAFRMADLIDELTSSTDGALTGRKDGLKARLDRLEKNIERENTRLEQVRENLTKKFSNLEQLITRMNSSSGSLLTSLSKLGG
ncbi:MAG: flagellar filament capping protein FliD [Magnetococcales bacterium]|nr:flagellar filament capping protein FliD [Magnetococcales bacterium]